MRFAACGGLFESTAVWPTDIGACIDPRTVDVAPSFLGRRQSSDRGRAIYPTMSESQIFAESPFIPEFTIVKSLHTGILRLGSIIRFFAPR